MFPNIKNKEQPIKSPVKNSSWDERFHLNQLPSYSALKDKHTKSYRKILMSNSAVKEINSPQSPLQKRKATYTEKLQQLIKQIHHHHSSYKEQLEEHFEKYKKFTPTWYMYYTFIPILRCTDIIAELQNETKLLKQKSTYYHRIETAIQVRQQCLKKVKETIKQFKEQEVLQKNEHIKNELNHVRLLTVNLIEEIQKWRDKIAENRNNINISTNLNLNVKPIYYTSATPTTNLLIQILNDSNFILKSKLSTFVNCGVRNDPFVLSPLKKSEGKEKSYFLDMVKLQKNRDMNYYQKYMDYLAGQKAFQMKKSLEENPPIQQQAPYIQKIYNQNKSVIGLQRDMGDSDIMVIEKQKVREERIKRNQEKINMIRGVYEKGQKLQKRYNSEKKLPDSQPEETKLIQRKKKEKSRRHESQFENLVKRKLDNEQYSLSRVKSIKVKKSKEGESKAQNKPKIKDNEINMISSLKAYEQNLKSKIRSINLDENQQDLLRKSSGPKSNEEIVRELKKEIIQKIDKQTQQKQMVKKKKRLQEQAQLQEIRHKMKRQMEQKIEKRRKQKLVQRQELEKKLKEQQDKLTRQRELQLQLQSKINRQRQQKQIQKLKRQALQKQYKLQRQLQKEQQLRKQREQVIMKQREEKQKLIQQLKKNELKEDIEKEVKYQIKEKQHKVQQIHRQEQREIKQQHQQKEQTIRKDMSLIKLKQQQQMSQIDRENELRSRMLILKQQQEMLKKKQLQFMMRNVINNEKHNIQQQHISKQVQYEEEIKNNAKHKLQQEYENERKHQLQIQRIKKEKAVQEEAYRKQVRERLQKELRLQAIKKTKKEIQERQDKNLQKLQKVQKIKEDYRKNFSVNKKHIEEEEKEMLVQKTIFQRQAKVEHAKNSLRSQFQKELFTSGVPHFYEDKESFQLKHTQKYLNDDHLYLKMDKTKERAEKQKRQAQEQEKIRQKERKQMKHILSTEELHIYEKKKNQVNKLKEQHVQLNIPEEQNGYELVQKKQIRDHSEDQYRVRVVREQAPKKEKNKQKVDKEIKKKKQNNEQFDSQDQQFKKKQKVEREKKKRIVKESNSEIDSQDNKETINKKKVAQIKKKKKVFMDDDMPNDSESDYHEKKKIVRQIQSNRQDKKYPKKRDKDSQEQLNPNVKIHYDVQQRQKKQKQVAFNRVQPITIKKINSKPLNEQFKFEINVQAIPQDELDRYLGGHFARIPQTQQDVFLYDREQLYRKLVSQLSFCLLIGTYLNKQMGLALAYHERNRSDLRKMTIVHIATYKNEDLKQFILTTSNYIFRKDPCDQVQFAYVYNETQDEQISFSEDFNKWFDKYGSVYQKKVDREVFERKYVFKRQFNQKCEVVLNGVNKNTFRNIFSVYAGVLMSDTNMVQFKQQLKDILTPEQEVSYAILISQLFRSFLTPTQAQALKGKVKDFAKLKELLVVVVNLQKKKIKMQQLKLYEYPTLIQLNMKLLSQGKDVIRYIKDTGVQLNQIFYCELSHGFNLPFNFQVTSLPVEAKQEQVRQISYFRLTPLPPYKLHIIKSSLYNGQMNLLPTENSKYKMFVMNAQQYIDIKENSSLDLFMYIRLFLKNVRTHNIAAWKYVWLPQMVDKASYHIRQFKSFLNKDIYCHDYVNFSFKQFLPSALIIEPQHRDLVITPPFIIGVMSMTLQQVTQGSPLYARLIDVQALKTMEIQE